MLTLDLIQEEDALSPRGADGCDTFRVNLDKSLAHLSPDCPRSKTDGGLSARIGETSGKSQSLPREVAVVWEQTGPAQIPQPEKRPMTAERSRCASMDEILTHSETKAAKNKTTASRSPASTLTDAVAPVSQLQQLISQKLQKTEQLLTEVRGEAEGGVGERGKMRGRESTEGARADAQRLLTEALATWSQAQEVLEEVKELRALYRQLDSSSPLTPPNSKLNPGGKSLM